MGILGLCAAGMAAFFAYLIWANSAIVITKYMVSLEKKEKLQGKLRIVQVSDLQSAHFGREQYRLLEKVKEANPDVIVFTGDLPDRTHTDYTACLTAMTGLMKVAPVYYTNGNHELALPQSEIRQMYRELSDMGVELLFDRGIFVGQKGMPFLLAGLSEETLYEAKTGARPDNPDFEKDRNLGRGRISDTDIDPEVIRKSMEISLKMAEREFVGQRKSAGELREIRTKAAGADDCEPVLKILLVHEPQFLETYAEGKFDLIFAGHAHGGQIRLPFTQGLFAPGQGVLPKLTSGIHKRGHSVMVISRGLGNSTFPLRVFNRPELVVVELCGNSKME